MKIKDIISGRQNPVFPRSRLAVQHVGDILKKDPVQVQPLIMKDSAGREFKIFVEAVSRDQGRVIVIGWSTHPGIALTLLQDGQQHDSKVTRYARGDVAQSLSLPSGDSLGFTLISQKTKAIGSAALQFKIPHASAHKTGPLTEAKSLRLRTHSQ